ncbi:DUF106 domain-containing protein [Methanobrevibacter sp. DSM 116169]|uniref:DUF106 domain-containing protein n=1 Tax=Methanobrevibacter sp. DSM 116169 TaxID=3242727 RepID=UPI0038FC2174
MADIFTAIGGFVAYIMAAINDILNPLIALDPNPSNPILTVFVISLVVSIITTVANKLLVDHDEMNDIREEMKEFQNELREAQKSGDSKKIAKLQAKQVDFMEKQSKMMTNSFKPAIVTMVPILLVFWWMRSSAISDLIVNLPVTVYYGTLTPIWHTIGPLIYGGEATIPFAIGWLLWYFICTLAIGQILRKFVGIKQGF